MRYRTVFISDTHLGAWGTKTAAATEFLTANEFTNLYLVGDIFDFWSLRRKFYWPVECNAFVQTVLALAGSGVNVFYIPGNHDEEARYFAGREFGGVQVRLRAVHETLSGDRMLVVHGDALDVVITRAKWISKTGAVAYDKLIWLNHWLHLIRSAFGMPEWSLSKAVKHSIKQAVAYMNDFEQALVILARQQGCGGVICGHIHHPEDKIIAGVRYLNTGDWVESLSCVVEHLDGRLELLR